MNLNSVVLIGHLTRDPKMWYAKSGTTICELGMAINRKYGAGEEQKEEVCFIDVTVFGKQGELCAQYLTKGSEVAVEGRLTFRRWETDDGVKGSKHEVVAERVTFGQKGQG